MVHRWIPGLVAAWVMLSGVGALADELELLNGMRVKGKVAEQTTQFIRIEVAGGDGSAEMKFPLAKVHAVTVDGDRKVLNEKASKSTSAVKVSPKADPADTEATTAEAEQPSAKAKSRTKAEVDALIQKAGTTPPDWWDSVQLDYPQTLDMTWPKQVKGPWDPQRNIGQYIWSTINENPSRWRPGIKFLHHLLTVFRDDKEKLGRAMNDLAGAYYRLQQDWARAAFWWRKAAELGPLPFNALIDLAECYWKLGNRAMAVAQLGRATQFYSVSIIKLWSDMGDLDTALRDAEDMAKARPQDPYLVGIAYLAAADACRLHGKYQRADAYYQKVLAVPLPPKNDGGVKRNQARARASLEAMKLFDQCDPKKVPDGIYTATCPAYAGPLSVAVAVKGGRIESVKVTRHEEKQYYAALTVTPQQIVEKQTVKGIDAVTGATMTSEAIINATAKAIAAAGK